MTSKSPTRCPAQVLAYDHVGMRVSDRQESLDFYGALGFDLLHSLPQDQAAELVSAKGVHISLIFNGQRQAEARNVLLDEATRLPGVTHPAFLVDDLSALHGWLKQRGIRITEGPRRIGPRRVALFIRDPDGNVLEFDQLADETADTCPEGDPA